MDQPPLIPGIDPKQIDDQTHAEAQRVFEFALGDFPGGDRYKALIRQGWEWRKAAYIAWASLPRGERFPKTLDTDKDGNPGFSQIIGLSDASAIRDWRSKNKAIDAMVSRFSMQGLMEHIADVDKALVESASDSSYKNKPDRDLFYLRTGVIVPRAKVGISIEDESVGDALETMTDEQLIALAMELEAGDSDDTPQGGNEE